MLDLPPGRVAFSTDTFVVSPLFFPGGDIGDLAINGTVNDVAMSGAEVHALSVGFVLEEGLPLADFHRILCSMETAAKRAGVRVVTGDTKVVGKGSCDGIFINTSGVGVVPDGMTLASDSLAEGDAVLLSGTLADHGMAVMTVREGLSFQSSVSSDTAALNGMVRDLLDACPGVKALRDPTRGGMATTLNEFATASGVGIKLDGEAIPVKPDVAGACEILGIDPLYVANEGKLIAIVPGDEAEAALAAVKAHPLGADGGHLRAGRGRSSRAGHARHRVWRRAYRGHAGGRAAAPDLLEHTSRPSSVRDPGTSPTAWSRSPWPLPARRPRKP